MKKLLILAYDFPPYVSVGGLRPYAWYKYLHEYNVEPVVITRQWANKHGNHLDYIEASESAETIVLKSDLGTLICTPYKPNLANRLMLKFGEKRLSFIRKSISAFYEFAQWIWNIGPKSGLYRAAREYLKNNRVDAIIATGDPFILFKYASNLSKEFNIPWIADYRDPWSQNKKNNSNLFKKWNQYFEKKYLKNVSLIITVSDFVKYQISTLITNKSFAIIPNGYDPEAVAKVSSIKQRTEYFSIGFVGTIYPWHPILPFLKVVSAFISEHSQARIKLNFYGINIADQLKDWINNQNPNLVPCVTLFPKIQNEQLLPILAKDNVMLLFNDYSIIGTKIFDYIGIRRSILLCFSYDSEAQKLKEEYYNLEEVEGLSHFMQEDLIKETNAGYIVENTSHLKVLLTQLYDEFIKTGEIKCNTKNIELYSRKKQTEKLAEIVWNLTLTKNEVLNRSEDNRKVSNLHLSYRQCTRCVMDTSDPEITFDEHGYCNHCTTFLNETIHKINTSNDLTKLEHIIKKIKEKGKNKKYDCVLGISGGVDSCYTAYLLKKYGVRVLAVHMDNGWDSEISVKNIKDLLDKLEMDYESYVLDWNEFRDLQLAFLKASIPEIETPTDIAILAILHKVAAKHGVKYIVSGGNYVSEGILPRIWHYNAKDIKYLKYIHRQFGKGKLKRFPLFGFWHESYYKFVRQIKIIYLLNYINYNKDEARKILENEFGWRHYGGKHYESRITAWVQSYLLPVKFNIDYRKATFSSLICMNLMTREEALELLKQPTFKIDEVENLNEYICKKFEIKREELDEIIKAQPRWYYQYPNNYKILNYWYKLYRKLFVK